MLLVTFKEHNYKMAAPARKEYFTGAGTRYS